MNEGGVMRKVLKNEPLVGAIASIEPFNIMIPDYDSVYDYLFDHPDMAELLPFVCETARKRVEDDMQLSLELYRDAEINDSHLSLYIRSHRYDERVLNAMRDIESAYVNMLVGKTGWIVVTTDFNSPG
jgi:hypothetical protein